MGGFGRRSLDPNSGRQQLQLPALLLNTQIRNGLQPAAADDPWSGQRYWRERGYSPWYCLQ